MKISNSLLTITCCTFYMLLIGCGGSSNNDSDSLKVDDIIIEDGKVHTEDGTAGAMLDYDNTGLQTVYDGLTVEKSRIIDGEGNAITGEEVKMNSKFTIEFRGVKNFTIVDGKAFPKFTLLLNGEEGMILNEDDLFAGHKDGLSVEEASVLSATIDVKEPMKPGGQYMCTLNVVDKNNSDFVLMANWLFTVVEE